MPAECERCSGCDKLFTARGYSSHLLQTQDPLCKAVYEELQRAHAIYERLVGGAGNVDADVELEDVAVPFQGDMFGSAEDYAEDLSGQGPDEDGSPNDSSNNLGPELMSESESEDDIAQVDVGLEASWEPIREGAPLEGPGEEAAAGLQEPSSEDPFDDDDEAAQRRSAERVIIGDGHGIKPARVVRYSDKYPSSAAGGVLARGKSQDQQYRTAMGAKTNPWAPFASKLDWEVAQWAKLRGVGSTAFSDLLAIDGVCEALKLSFKNSEQLNKIVDSKLPGRPEFKRHEVVIGGEVLEFYSRDPLECLEALWGDPEFVNDLIVEPERHYADEDMTIRLYHDMQTANWWWSVQKEVQSATRRKNITIVPIIISSDKTQLTHFRGKTAYPVYFTIGNLPKHIRRKPSRQGQVLLGYLPTSKLDQITNKASRRRCVSNLFHHCMQYIVKPLEQAGREGIVLASGDGALRRCYPILAAYVGDYPEQILVGLVKNGRCPICPAPPDKLQDLDSILEPRGMESILQALNTIDEDAAEFVKACSEAGIKPVQCVFWKNLPFVDIYRSITPDILHQLYQGLLKHLISWIRAICGDAEIDARCRRLPPNHCIRLFLNGISHLSRVTGTEHDQISRFLLALVADIRLPNGHSNAQLVRSVRAVLDFINLARYPIHSAETLDQMDNALRSFHANRGVFISLGVRAHFNIPKLHTIGHYRQLIVHYGTADNFNTECTERLHIDLAKDAYSATNFKDEFPQMTNWLDRKERVMQHGKYVRRHIGTSSNTPLHVQKPVASLIPQRRLRMAKHPTHRAVPLSDIQTKYGAMQFVPALSRFVSQYQNPAFSKAQVEAASHSVHIPFAKIAVFHRIKFVSYDVYGLNPLDEVVVDSIHVDPARLNKYSKVVPGRFDTALISIAERPAGDVDIKGFCVGQVRCIFTLPQVAIDRWFSGKFSHKHLAYVEWFTPFSKASVDRNSMLFKVSRLKLRGERRASIIPVSLIYSSIHLFPKFGPQAPTSWTSSNVLDTASSFYVNAFSDRFIYSTVY
ncbi:hypothetical protein CVT26_002941 [Gymnopilus dilepis]|uniref:C2H2-type domain-containing protein n=1 Tax=Gymnopilus dilepis TaxID=231916 RepID=A0A409Y4G7_9AGAR|nr:hypothetical protein CVT26_002941 [Gymnopilus dilepis]